MPNEEANGGGVGFVGAATVGNQTEFRTVASTTPGGRVGWNHYKQWCEL